MISMATLHRLNLAVALTATAGLAQATTAGCQPTESSTGILFPRKVDPTGTYTSTAAWVGDNLLITGQPTADALRELRRQGFSVVVNLRSPSEMARVEFDEAKLVEELGMKYVYLPVRGTEEFPYSPAALEAFTEIMKSSAGEKVLFHCTVAWRTSHLWAAYLIEEKQVPVQEALRHAEAINLMRGHGSGPAPVEEFLGRRLPELQHPETSQP